LHEGIVVFGENGRLNLSNPMFRSLWKLDVEFTASEPHMRDVFVRCRDFFVTDDWANLLERMLARFQSRQLITMRLERSDGSVINCAAVPLPDGATLLSFVDITDSTLVERSLRERADALETADRLKTDFLANMSYELRSPLTSISGFAEMLNREYAGALNPSQKEYVDGIYQSSQHLAALIGDIIDLATIEAGFLKLDIRPFPVRSAIDSVLTLLATRLKIHNLTINVEVGEAIDVIDADEVRFKQILINLLSNAVKLAKARGTILVRVSKCAQGHAALTVHNVGVTLDETRVAQMFDPFLRTGNAPGADSMLSLGLVKRFTELHGGTVHVTSTAEEGTAIMCVFPRPSRSEG
jgi:signal transduction histidine kinase